MILIDISNTNTKLALVANESNTILVLGKIATKLLSTDKIDGLVGEFDFTMIVCASVVPNKNEIINEWAKLRDKELLFVNSQIMLGIGIDYPNPVSIGADRLVNAVALDFHHKRGLKRAVVGIDFGTAVSFDVINEKSEFVGGVIAPGLDMMNSYFSEKTALLPKLDFEEPSFGFGKNTRDAMLCGAVHGYRGMIIEILRNINLELGVDDTLVIATGSYASLICSGIIANLVDIDPLLTFRGLARIGEINKI